MNIHIQLQKLEQQLLEQPDSGTKEIILRQKERLEAYLLELTNAWKKYPELRRQTKLTEPVGIGIQSFSEIIEKNMFYVDKTMFIKAWWQDGSKVTLITRPRRFGKSLNLDMLDCFFSSSYQNRSDLFKNLQIWDEGKLRSEQGKWPVLHLDLSGIKADTYEGMCYQMTQLVLEQQYRMGFLQKEGWNSDSCWTDERIAEELHLLCIRLSEVDGKRVLILIDEYDTPLQETWKSADCGQILGMMRLIFHNLLKNNEYLEKALLTGVTRISRESLFSDLNNVSVSTVTDDRFAPFFGFTEEEVFAALDSQDLKTHEKIKAWYDGFSFGGSGDIYNPWSITNYLKTGRFDTYWANTSANTLLGELLRKSGPSMKQQFELLMAGEHLTVQVQENLIWEDLERDERLIWGLLLATGYVTGRCRDTQTREYEIRITNREVMLMFEQLLLRWFSGSQKRDYEDFLSAMLRGDAATMEDCLNELLLQTISYFDIPMASEGRKTENFYHGFVLGMCVSLKNDYLVTSNRESGRGRYDVMLEPREKDRTAVILEFKLCREGDDRKMLEASAREAIGQIEARGYAQKLIATGISEEVIYKYGISFAGKNAVVMRA